jgi:cysteine-rich repeat protein/predicted outer membrane repeat protein
VCDWDCGDGLVRGDESCDDGNTADGDGCGADCTLEPGWQCSGEPTNCLEVLVFYVRSGATGGDGSSWATAVGTIQAGVDIATAALSGNPGAVGEVWVASGTYLESVVVTERVFLIGGFAGTESQKEERSWRTQVTRIDGQGTAVVVVEAEGLTTGGIDGFEITGAVYGGIDIDDCDEFFIRNSTVHTNDAGKGGGLFVVGTDITIEGCRFVDNHASDIGGAIYAQNSYVRLKNSILRGNSATMNGDGVAMSGTLSTLNAHHVTFYDNGGGSAVYMREGYGHIANCILWQNDITDYQGTYLVAHSLVQGGVDGEGILNEDPLFVAPATGDLRLQGASPCIDAALGHYATEEDLDGNPRYDDPSVPNTGTGEVDYADLGALEYSP